MQKETRKIVDTAGGFLVTTSNWPIKQVTPRIYFFISRLCHMQNTNNNHCDGHKNNCGRYNGSFLMYFFCTLLSVSGYTMSAKKIKKKAREQKLVQKNERDMTMF